MKKINHILNKLFAIYEKKNLVPMKMIKNIIKSKINDQCHYTTKYRAAAHTICNLRYKTLNEIPVLFHNDSKYDYHFLIKKLTG